MSISLGPFEFFQKFAEIFGNKCLSPVSMTPAISCSPMSMTPAINLLPVSLTPAINPCQGSNLSPVTTTLVIGV
jgi:hypothetical protein